MAACCPTCGRAFTKPKATAELTDTATTAERVAYFKKTAPLEDAKFALRIGASMSPGLEADWRAHVARIEAGTAGSASQIHAMTRKLQERKRVELLAYGPSDVAELAFWKQVATDSARAKSLGLNSRYPWPPSQSDMDSIEEKQRRRA